ncbi:MAG: FecR family protein [Vicinamibacteraceae bacterium]
MMPGYDGGEPAAPAADRIAQLLKLAGRRPMPDPHDMRTARAAAHTEWLQLLQRRRRRASLLALAASLLAVSLLGTAASLWLRPQMAPAPGAEIGTLKTMRGAVAITGVGRQRTMVSESGTAIRAGDRIETPAGSRAAFTLSDAVSVRLDERTMAVLDAADHLTLDRGAVYIDSGPGPPDATLHVETPLGLVQHVGTQFEVRLQSSTLGVRVREGSIVVQDQDESWTSQAGEALLFRPGRPPERQAIATSGPGWSWVAELAEPFHLEGATVPAFLEWVSREQGWRWEYESASLQERVDRIVLHGSIEGLTPAEALEAVLPTCGLAFRREGDRLIVRAAAGA